MLIFRSTEIYDFIESDLEENSNIQYTCQELAFDYNGEWVYPISLDRIKGSKNPNEDPDCDDYFLGSTFIFPFKRWTTFPYPMAYTVLSAPGQELYEIQLACTGSTEIWSDMTILSATDRSADGIPVTFEQWPSFLGKQNWKDIIGFEEEIRPTTQSLNVQYPMTINILHELMHSAAAPTPIGIPS